MRSSRPRPDSVFDEPHLRARPAARDETDGTESVWHEPTTARNQQRPSQLPYAAWLNRRRGKVTSAQSLGLFIGLALFGGPLAILSVVVTRAPGFGYILVVITGPLIEEIGKVLLPLMIVERKPYWFIRSWPIVVCAATAGGVFAVVENLLYLNVYLADPSPWVIRWRWTVCVALHTGCSVLAGIGVAQIHRDTMRLLRPPKLETGAPWIVAAVLMHGLYNMFALLIDPYLR